MSRVLRFEELLAQNPARIWGLERPSRPEGSRPGESLPAPGPAGARRITFEDLVRTGGFWGPPGPGGAAPPALLSHTPGYVRAHARSRSSAEWEAILLRVFDVFRSAGVTPHPAGGTDADWAADLAASLAAGNPGMSVSPEECVQPDPRIGINCQPAQVGFGVQSSNLLDAYRKGWAHQIASDAARIGCGVFRRFGEPDLSFRSLFPGGTVIPSPSTLIDNIVAGDFEVCAEFTLLAIFCALRGMSLVPTLFDYGGGSKSMNTPAALAGMSPLVPDHLDPNRLLYPAEGGWDEIYWNHSGVRPWSDYARLQRYVLILEVPDDIDVPFPRSFSETDYYRECARRKKLALLAFSEGIKRYLFALYWALDHCGRDADLQERRFSMPSLDRVIPYMVIGNEMDHFWVTEDGKARASAMEMGWFHVLLSAPLRVDSLFEIQNVGLGLAELSSYVNKDEKGPKLAWLENVLHTGLPVALEALQWMFRGSEAFQRALMLARTSPLFYPPSSIFAGADSLDDLVLLGEEIKAWELSCVAVGYSWITAETIDADRFLGIGSWTEFVQLVGLHWYHHWSTNSITRGGSWYEESHPERLLNENDLIEDVEDFLAVTYHHVPTWWLSEIGFPAEKPWITDQWRVPDAVWNPRASPRLQAIVVARRMLLLRCLERPPAMLVWWDSMSGVVGEDSAGDTDWRQFSAMGLRNDCARSLDVRNRSGDSGSFHHDFHAWARPSWYAFRRVAWLLSQATSGEIVFSDASRNAMVLKLTGRFRLPGGASRRSYDSLLVAWMDPRVVVRRFSLWFRSEGEVVRVSLVPDVAPVIQDPNNPDLDGNHYPTLAVPDWTWPGWDCGILSQHPYPVGYWQWTDTVVSTQPQAPFCILANGLGDVSVGST